jgi:hypothetical protein
LDSAQFFVMAESLLTCRSSKQAPCSDENLWNHKRRSYDAESFLDVRFKFDANV